MRGLLETMNDKTKVNELTVEQLRFLIEDVVDEKLIEWFGDPDEGLEVREEVIQRLKAHKTSKKARIPMEEVAREFGIKFEE